MDFLDDSQNMIIHECRNVSKVKSDDHLFTINSDFNNSECRANSLLQICPETP